MRLLKTGPYVPGKERLEVIQKWGQDIPPYAILSHTWSLNPEDEVSFADIQNGTSATKPAEKTRKVRKAIERAKFDGYGFLWIDTCCIDKTSSVELSEAINSMYRYYENAQKCYAFLADVSTADFAESFAGSRWWRRGWTLQELLAPTIVEFFSSDWETLGTKTTLRNTISQITGIESEYLAGNLPVQHASIAKRMSWASARQTTREEDLAYCLIGVFEVNMAMLYGEGGQRAFVRLQEEIMRSNEDQSLFAWIKEPGDEEGPGGYHGLLADSPKDFKHTGNTISYSELTGHNPSTMTARGLHMTLPLTQKNDLTSIAVLQCPVPGRGYNDWLAIYLKRLPAGVDQYARVTCTKLASISEVGKPQEVYVRQYFPRYAVQTLYPYHFFQLRGLSQTAIHPELYPDLAQYIMIAAVHNTEPRDAAHGPATPRYKWSNVSMVYKINKQARALAAAILVTRPDDEESFVLMLGAMSEFEVGFDVSEAEAIGSLEEMQHEFSPQPAGTLMNLRYHNVRVIIEEQVRAGQKVYFVDLDIQAFPKPSTITEVVQDAVDLIAQPKGPERSANKAAFRDKVKRLWPVS